MRSLPVGLLGVWLLMGCNSGEAPAPSSESSVAKQAPNPPTPSRTVKFQTDDGLPLAGTFYAAADTTAPLLVLIHRFRGDKSEWAPLADRMAKADKRYSILNFDLRGHGESSLFPDKEGKRLNWENIDSDDAPLLVKDVLAAIGHGLEQTKGKARSVALVGSSLGAALAVSAAGEQPKVTAVALVSPGASILGMDVYRPFAQVRDLPSFLALAEEDTVSTEPIRALSAMAKSAATVKTYKGQG